jgi:hypothetical protein
VTTMILYILLRKGTGVLKMNLVTSPGNHIDQWRCSLTEKRKQRKQIR